MATVIGAVAAGGLEDDLATRTEKTVRALRRGTGALGVVSLVALPGVLALLNRPSYLTASVHALIVGIVAISLVMLLGYVGQVSLAQFAFMGIGALVVARVAPYTGYWAALPLAGLAAVPAGLVAALPAIRLRGIYLAVATLGFSQVIVAAVLLNPNIAGGVNLHVDPPHLGGWSFTSTISSRSLLYFVILGFVAVFALFTLALRPARTGLAFTSVRDSELAAASVGVNVVKYKLIAFSVSSFYAAVAGGLYMALSPDVDPTYIFGALTGSIPLLILVVLGGVSSIAGALLASFIFALSPIFMPQFIDWVLGLLHIPWTFPPNLTLVIFGIALIKVLQYTPNGIMGLLDRLFQRIAERRHALPGTFGTA